MTRQNLRKHAAFVLLDHALGRISIEEITDRLIEIGYIENDPEDYRRWQVEQARNTIRDHRKSKVKSGEIQLELGNLHETLEDGSTVHYYKHVGEMTPEEAVQHIGSWDERIAESRYQRQRYYDFHLDRHGREFQRLLGLDDLDGPAN
jgi:hypothetical protein